MKDQQQKKQKEDQAQAVQALANDPENELRPLFESLDSRGTGSVSLQQVQDCLQEIGIPGHDVRLQLGLGKPGEKTRKSEPQELNFEGFTALLKKQQNGLLKKSLLRQLAIPDFKAFRQDMEEFFHRTKDIADGEVNQPTDESLYGISVCTIDGQQLHLGDYEQKFPLQSVCKAINYAIALHEVGEEKVHQHVGREPSGRGYNGLVLNEEGLPHNPMINAGAIMTCSLLKPELTLAKRLKHVTDVWSRACGDIPVGVNKAMAATDITTSERNMALSYHMKENNAFPEKTDLYQTMELYLKCCSIELDVTQLAVAAATLANGGICPTTGQKVFSPDDVRDCLSLMLSCGMYDYSGEFAFLVGLPAKSGVSGAMMVVVPGLLGIAIYSPPLDAMGNTVRGVAFCKELVKEYSFHKFDHVAEPSHRKKDPRLPRLQSRHQGLLALCWAASQGDLAEVQNLLAQGVPAEAESFDRRTPLHLAAAGGHLEVTRFLLKLVNDPSPRDRWNRTPLADALHGKHQKVAALLRKHHGKE